MFVAGGFAEVTPERCTVLANEVMPPVNCTRRRASAAWPKPKRRWRRSTPADIVAEELALERAQSARALIEAVDGLLTGR